MPFKPGREAVAPNYKRLNTILNNSRIKEKDSALYQVIKSLIDYGGQANTRVDSEVSKINEAIESGEPDGGTNGGTGGLALVVREIPTGLINGVNTVFILSNVPIVDSEQIFLNGLLQDARGIDYSISSATVTFLSPPLAGDRILATYQRG
jgi:hypothetical protein